MKKSISLLCKQNIVLFFLREIIGEEVVSAAINANGNKVLMFAGVEGNGNVEIRIKTRTKEEQNELYNEVLANI